MKYNQFVIIAIQIKPLGSTLILRDVLKHNTIVKNKIPYLHAGFTSIEWEMHCAWEDQSSEFLPSELLILQNLFSAYILWVFL